MGASPQEEEVAIEQYVESPSWRFTSRKTRDNALPKISATFMFATRLPGHVRLEALSDKLRGDSAAWQSLVEPTESYFSDIVRGGLGRTGRPLVILCEPERNLDEQIVVMRRPESTDYFAERHRVRLWRSDPKRAKIGWAIRDAFALFESGHLLYLLSLVSIDDQLDRIDEYALIQLQKLLDPSHEATAARENLKFRFGLSPPDTLAGLVKARLDELGSREMEEPNGVHILKSYALDEVWEWPSFGWDELKSLIFAIEDDKIWNDFATRKARLKTDIEDPKTWQKRPSPIRPDRYPPHLSPKCRCPRLYALSGFLHGVLDFPFQDTSELEDALEPLCPPEEDWAAFCNRHCIVEIGTSEWRSLRDARTTLGTCPYFALVQCMALYHELLLSELESKIDDLLYPPEDGNDSRKRIHARAMVDVATMLGYARKVFWPPSGKIVERNLRQRIAIFRDLLIFLPINVFNYGMEKDLLDALVAYHKMDARTAAVMDLLDRYEGLVEDNHHVLTMAAERRLGLVLFVIAAIGLLTIYGPIEALFADNEYNLLGGHPDPDRIVIVVSAFALMALYLLWPRKK